MIRPRNFKNDLKIGKLAENALRARLMNERAGGRIQIFEDVTDDPKSMFDDIDFKAIMNDGSGLTFECKTDVYGIKTRNVVYEVTSFNRSGGIARTNADYIHYVFIGGGNEIAEEYLIKLKTWRKWMGCLYREIKPFEPDSKGPLQMNYVDDIGGIHYMCNIDVMVDDGVAVRLGDDGLLFR